jgi:predicted ATP-grasp superfamily ATP-dependent carboligase
MTRLLIAGVSVRAFAQSAVAAGYEVTAVDAYGDLDLRAIAEVVTVPAPYTAMAAARVARMVGCDAVAYTSNFENHPTALAVLATGRTLLGNDPAVVARAREPGALPGSAAVATSAPARGDWLLKPRASGGGHGIRPWSPGQGVPRGAILQERIEGVPGSVVFTANGVLGVTRQLIGDPAFGATGFRYCGNILVDGDHDALAARVTAIFGLTGVNGVDFIVRERDGAVVPIEINPRYTAAMELIERRDGISIAAAHAGRAIGSRDSGLGTRGTMGKAIVYARRAVTVGETRDWLGDDSVADIPMPGTRVPSGRPICTVFAAGADVDACYARLVERANRIYATVESKRAAA